MSNIVDRYSHAAHSGNLANSRETTGNDLDILGAAGFAAKSTPLGMALLRLFVGDNHAASEIVRILAQQAVGKAYRLSAPISHPEAEDMARAVLAWHRDSRCKPCGGHGVGVIKGTTTLGDDACPACRGAGRVSFDHGFSLERLELARWLSAEVEREQGRAGPEARRRLAPRLDL